MSVSDFIDDMSLDNEMSLSNEMFGYNSDDFLSFGSINDETADDLLARINEAVLEPIEDPMVLLAAMVEAEVPPIEELLPPQQFNPFEEPAVPDSPARR